MSSEIPKSIVSTLLLLNLLLYFIALVIASLAINHGIDKSRETASVLTIPARIFPIYFPMGNVATGFFVIYSLLMGVMGVTTSITGLTNVSNWDAPNSLTAAASSMATWSITLLAMGLACRGIQHDWTDSNLRTLEIITIILSGTQTFCTTLIQSGVEEFLTQ